VKKNIKELYKNPWDMSMSIHLLPSEANSDLTASDDVITTSIVSASLSSESDHVVDAPMFLNANAYLLTYI